MYRAPTVLALLIAPLFFPGSQLAALGAIRVPTFTPSLISQILLVNLAGAALLVAAVFAAARAILLPRNPAATLLGIGLFTVLGLAAAIVGLGLFLAGPERFLALEEILTALVAAPAILLLASKTRSRRSRILAAGTLLVVVFVSVSSYRVDGNVYLSRDVPKQTDVLRPELNAAVATLKPHVSADDTLTVDPYVAFYGTNFPSHADVTFWREPLPTEAIRPLEGNEIARGALFAWNVEATARLRIDAEWGHATALADRAYDNGLVVGGVG
jgi:hypothetical protein